MLANRDFQPAWLLHSQPYGETSALAWFLTLEEGRINALVKGVRSNKSRYRALLQAFTPLQARFSGTTELHNLIGLESTTAPPNYQGASLICGLYANELLARLLLPKQACPQVFKDYSLLLQLLPNNQQREPALRRFEFSLLEFLGHPLVFHDLHGQALQPELLYSWVAQAGFKALINANNRPATPKHNSIYGHQLLAIQQDDWRCLGTLSAAKQLSRQLLAPLLGSKPLRSRQLFLSWQRHQNLRSNTNQPMHED